MKLWKGLVRGLIARQSITKSGSTVATVYDGYSPVQEKTGGLVSADLLTGPGIDERFTRTDSSATATYLTDLLGSTMALTDDCQSGGNYGATAMCEVSRKKVCRDCAVKLLGLQDMSAAEQTMALRPFLLRPDD